MSFKLVSNLIDDVAGSLQGTNLNNVTNLYGAFERAARIMASIVSVPEASGRSKYSIYDRVFDYSAPDTIFGSVITDFRPQGISRNPLDAVYKSPPITFDQNKLLLPNGAELTFEYKKGEGIMRVAQTRARQSIILDRMDDDDWTVGGSASLLTVDETVYYQAPASLRFKLTGSSSGYLEKAITQVNLTDYLNIGVVFLAIDTPSAANLASIQIRIGSSSANYYSLSVTEGFLGAWEADDFTTLVAFDLSQASQTGSPDFSAVDYIRLTFTHTATLVNMRVGSLFIALPTPYELLFQSSAIFMTDDTPATEISGNNDEIILNPSAYLLFEHESARQVSFQEGGADNNPTYDKLTFTLEGNDRKPGLYGLYMAKNPSEEINTVGNYLDD